MSNRRNWLWRGVVVLLVSAMVGVITFAAMPARLPPELDFLWQLNPEVTDTTRHVGCASSEEIFPSQTLRVAMNYPEFQALLRKNLDGRPDWKVNTHSDGADLLAQKLPWLHYGSMKLPTIEIRAVRDSSTVQQVQVTDFRKPYNYASRWIIRFRGR